jgi:hypothetical protein
MGLKAEIQDAMKAALKSGDRPTLSALRLLLSALHNEEIKQRAELAPDDEIRIVSSLCKQRQEAIEYYRKGNRTDLIEKEETDLAVLRGFLPQALGDEEVRALVQRCINEMGAAGVADFGKVMKEVMPKVAGRAEGKRVGEIARELLGR